MCLKTNQCEERANLCTTLFSICQHAEDNVSKDHKLSRERNISQLKPVTEKNIGGLHHHIQRIILVPRWITHIISFCFKTPSPCGAKKTMLPETSTIECHKPSRPARA
jgi:hypothetical protein